MENCIFCKIAKGEIKSWKVYENDYVFAFFDINPVSEYHTLVVSKKHYENIFDIPENELLEIIKAVKIITTLYNQKLGIKNIQIVSNSGIEAQQEVFHIHFHIVPRQEGDSQNINWTHKIELRNNFDQLLEKLK
jgi:histidine triad (HIT) family protein